MFPCFRVSVCPPSDGVANHVQSSRRRSLDDLLKDDRCAPTNDPAHGDPRIVLEHDALLGKKYGISYAEGFHYIGPVSSRVDELIKRDAVPLKR